MHGTIQGECSADPHMVSFPPPPKALSRQMPQTPWHPLRIRQAKLSIPEPPAAQRKVEPYDQSNPVARENSQRAPAECRSQTRIWTLHSSGSTGWCVLLHIRRLVVKTTWLFFFVQLLRKLSDVLHFCHTVFRHDRAARYVSVIGQDLANTASLSGPLQYKSPAW